VGCLNELVHPVKRHRPAANAKAVCGQDCPISGAIISLPEPIHINGDGRRKEIGKFSERKDLTEFGHLSSFQIQVGQLNRDFFQALFLRVDKGVELRLRKVERICFAKPGFLNRFDFLQEHFFIRGEQTVDASPDAECKFAGFDRIFNGEFGLVTRWTRTLQLLVASDSFQSAIRSNEIPIGAQISATKHKLN
jgi:hypothetical protein